jgi:hypothetical protein
VLTPVVLATQEAEIRRIAVLSQPRQIVGETVSRKPVTKKWGADRESQGIGPEFKISAPQKKK